MNNATFAGGCFWCTEAVFQRLKGVSKVVSGYAGGDSNKTSYSEVSSGETGHAEAIQITFDESIIPYNVLLEIFFATHDPTTLNKQGNDIGTQYRSAIFYHNDTQKKQAIDFIKNLDDSGQLKSKVVTEVSPFTSFHEAENYHQNYYNSNSDQPYCQVIIDPKVKKLISKFSQHVKDEYKS